MLDRLRSVSADRRSRRVTALVGLLFVAALVMALMIGGARQSQPAASPVSLAPSTATATLEATTTAAATLTPAATASPTAVATPLPIRPTSEASSSRILLDVPGLAIDASASDAAVLVPTTTITTTTPTPTPTPASRRLDSVGEVVQTLNNCGPASVAMVLAYYGHPVTQGEAQASLRPDPEEWGMLPNVVAPYVQQFGLDARVLGAGTADDLKALLNQGVPVIVAQWLSEADPIPHYRVVIGYDDARGEFIVNDGVLGFGKSIPYAEFEGLWDVYANLYLPIYTQTDAPQVQATLSSQWDHTVTMVSQSASRPAWDEFLRAGGLGGTATPDEPTETPTPTPTPTLVPNTSAETAWPLTKDKAQAGELVGSKGGAYRFYSVMLDKDTPDNGHIEIHYTPDDPGIGHSLGLKIYNAHGDVVGEAVNTSGQVGTRSVALPTKAGAYLIQVYNYLPDVKLEFSLTYK